MHPRCRFGVGQLLGLLSDGLTLGQIQDDYPFIEQSEVAEALRYAAALAHRDHYLPTHATA